MSTIEYTPGVAALPLVPAADADSSDPALMAARRKPLHRIAEVREEQGMSLRSVARAMRADIRQLRLQEQASCDLRLSELYKWQEALGAPVADLLVEPESSLSRPVSERAKMVRIMKTAAAILQKAPNPGMQRMAQMLCEQLIDVMPELEQVGPWHEFGQRRSSQDYGAVMERRISDDAFWRIAEPHD
jgi:transcriptional regulator with XRE-family HTH domain